MLSRLIIGLLTGGGAALLLVTTVLITSAAPSLADVPMVLVGACIFAGIGLALAAENTRRAIGLPLIYAGLAGIGASVIGHLAALDIMFMDLTLEQRMLARINGSVALTVGVAALLSALYILRGRRQLSASADCIDENRDYLKGLNAYIDSDIRGWLAAHERDLYLSNRNRLILLGLGLPLTVAGILAVTAYYRPGSPPLWATSALAISALAMYCIAFAPRQTAPTSARNEIVSRLCTFFGLRHNDKGNGLELSPFRRLLMVPRYHRTRLDNVLWGRVAGHSIYMAEATLQLKVDRLTPLMPRYRTSFHGVLATLKLSQRPGGELVMLTPKRHHDLARRGIERSLYPVTSKDAAIDRLFRCSASSQALADRALAAAAGSGLAALVDRLGRNRLQIAISGDSVHITLATRKRWFGGARSTDFIGVNEIRQFVDDISTMFQVAEQVHEIDTGLCRPPAAEQPDPLTADLPAEEAIGHAAPLSPAGAHGRSAA